MGRGEGAAKVGMGREMLEVGEMPSIGEGKMRTGEEDGEVVEVGAIQLKELDNADERFGCRTQVDDGNRMRSNDT